jgi:hypothetical protein
MTLLDRWLLKRGSIHIKCSMTRHCNTDDCLIEVTTWTGLPVYIFLLRLQKEANLLLLM